MDLVLQFDNLEQKRAESGEKYLPFFDVGSLHCGIYTLAVGDADEQKPHSEDEVYFIQSGIAKIKINGEDFDLRPGSVIFAPAFAEHHFYDITEELRIMVMFSKRENARG
jgi:mannose-6-phosphate isomerase-like protein (cupin superfamily)